MTDQKTSKAPARGRKSPKCPICGKPQSKTYRPFCSKRCADVDLNRWLSGRYAFPGAPANSLPPTNEDEE